MANGKLEALVGQMVKAMDNWQDADGLFKEPEYDDFLAAAQKVRETLKESQGDSWRAVLVWLDWLDVDCKMCGPEWHHLCAAMATLVESNGFNV
jgi:hypothetical protein